MKNTIRKDMFKDMKKVRSDVATSYKCKRWWMETENYYAHEVCMCMKFR